MLQAIEAQSGMVVAAEEAQREARHVCPECGRLVGLRLGMRKVPHFAHYSSTLCTLAKPESPRHRALKWLCKKFFAPLPVVWEVPLGARRADALVGGLFVVECQVSPLAVQEWQARTESHNRLGFPVLWLWDVRRLCRKNSLAEAFALERYRRAVWTAPEIRLCHDESRDTLFVGDKHTIIPCRLSTLTSAEQAAAKNTGKSWPTAFFQPQALRHMTFFRDFDKNARFHFASRTEKLRLVRLGQGDKVTR
jgi:competence CoiA-like predicted nuclease